MIGKLIELCARHRGLVILFYVIAALGAGTVLGSFRPSRHRPTLRLAAIALAALAGCMLLFVNAPCMWVGIIAALGAGACCLLANSVTRAVLAKQTKPEQTAAVTPLHG